MNPISRQQLRKLMEENEDFTLINVLGKEQFDNEHIPGSINIPVGEHFAMEVHKKFPNKQRKIVVYCASKECSASPKAAEMLDKAGYSDVMDYEGGMLDWKEADYPTEKGD